MRSVQAPALVVDERTPDEDLKRAAFAVDRRTGEVVKDRRGRVSARGVPVMHPPPAPHDPRDNCDVTLSTADALIVGLSVRTHARTKLAGETAAAHLRVADQLIAAARRALAEGK